MRHLGSLDFIPFQVDQPDATDYELIYDCPIGSKIAQLRITSSFGSGVVSVLVNGVAVTGIDNVPVAANTRSQHSASGLNTIQPGDDVVLRIESTDGLLNVRGSLVITNKSILAQQLNAPIGFVQFDLPLVGALANVRDIPVIIAPPLHRNPVYIFPSIIVKNSPLEDDISVLNIIPTQPGDYSSGWIYRLSSESVAGQVMRVAYIK